ncbi:MAG: YidC/Oxa1 family membrane protein insertase [Brevinema sp.]
MLNILYYIIIFPFEMIFRGILDLCLMVMDPVWSLPVLSICLTLLSTPLFAWASTVEAKEKALKLKVKHEMDEVNNQYSGEALFNKTEEVYAKFHYNPLLAFRESMTLFVLIPLFAAAYTVLNNNHIFGGASGFGVADLAQPDALLFGFNILPFVMTGVNMLAIWIEHFPKPLFHKDNIKLLVLSGAFLIWLYNSSSALLIYWTCNNLFYLIRTLVFKYRSKNHA